MSELHHIVETGPGTAGAVEGGCACGEVRYRVRSRPLIVHACHCSRCQTQTGAAYVINALLDAEQVELEAGELEDSKVETPSGRGQTISRCPRCKVAVWSRYHALPRIGDAVLFVRVGTLDDPNAFPPDVHIHTATRLTHVRLPEDAAVFEGYYDARKVWSAESLQRAAAVATRFAAS